MQPRSAGTACFSHVPPCFGSCRPGAVVAGVHVRAALTNTRLSNLFSLLPHLLSPALLPAPRCYSSEYLARHPSPIHCSPRPPDCPPNSTAATISCGSSEHTHISTSPATRPTFKMRTSALLTTLFLAATTLAQAVEEGIAPGAHIPMGCRTSIDGPFRIGTLENPALRKRESAQEVCRT